MSKYLKVLILAMLAVGLIAGTAFAGTFKVNKGAATTPVTVAVEATGSNRAINIAGAGAANNSATNVAMSYTLGTSMTSGDLLQVVFTGVSFRATTYNVCAQNSGDAGNANINVGSKTLAAIVSSTNIPLAWSSASVGANAGNYLVITDGACNTATITLSIDSTTSTGFKTVSGNLLRAGYVIDDGTSANVANVMSQYSYDTVLASNTHTVDYLSGAKNGSQFTGSSNNAGTASALNITVNAVDYAAGSGTQNAGLTVATLINVQDSQSWQGVSKVFLTASAAGCAVSSNLGTSAYTAAPSGTVNLNVPAASFNATTATTAFDLCAITSGNVAINPRTITGSVDVNVTGTGANDKSASSYQTVQTWNVNAYQGIIPYISTTSTYKTICMINNQDTSITANISVDLLSSTSGTTVSSLSVGTVSPKTTKRVDFDTQITPYSTGTSEAAETPISLTGITDPQRYSAKLTVTANPTKVTVNCIQVDPAGSKRAVPVLTSPTALGTYWQQ